jgi:hypothetical protein
MAQHDSEGQMLTAPRPSAAGVLRRSGDPDTISQGPQVFKPNCASVKREYVGEGTGPWVFAHLPQGAITSRKMRR